MTEKVGADQSVIIMTIDGQDYTLDCMEFTARECGLLKRIGHIAGVAAIPAAIEALDLEAIVALAVIAMKRAGIIANPEELLDGEVGIIKLKFPESEDPPTPAPETGQMQPPESADCGILP